MMSLDLSRFTVEEVFQTELHKEQKSHNERAVKQFLQAVKCGESSLSFRGPMVVDADAVHLHLSPINGALPRVRKKVRLVFERREYEESWLGFKEIPRIRGEVRLQTSEIRLKGRRRGQRAVTRSL